MQEISTDRQSTSIQRRREMQEISSDRQSTSTSTSGEERLTRTVPDTSVGELRLKQSLLILCSLTAVSSVHYKIGDPRTLEDLLEREEDAWLPRVGTEDYKGLLSDAPTDQIISWSACASAFESAFESAFPFAEDHHRRPADGQINIDIAELRDQLRHYLEEMSRLQAVGVVDDDDDCRQRIRTGAVTTEAGAEAAAGPETGAETRAETGAGTGLVRRRRRRSSSSEKPQPGLNWKMRLWLVLFSCAVIPPMEAGGQLSSALWDTERLDLPQLAKFLSTSPLFRDPLIAAELEDWIGKLKGLFCGGHGH
ncbi:hypothetical protein H2202_002563 [Exophiala xenobiotica]|nr:hypothetical protein H2202_002563 [Exophiala xenobiotica]